MLAADLLRETALALTINKVRSGLTMLGIIIGIGSVITMIALGQGAQATIEERIQSIGSNLLTIRPGFQQAPGQNVSQGQGSAQSLTRADAEALRSAVPAIAAVAPTISRNYQVVASGQNTRTQVMGTTEEYITVRSLDIASGVFFTNDQDRRRAKVAVLGPEVVAALFPGYDNVTGQKVRINNIDFTVLGTTMAKGGSGFGSEDDVIFIPLRTAMQYLSGSETLSAINITIRDEAEMSRASEMINQILLERHNLATSDQADFRIMNQADIVETATSITSTFTLLLGAVAGISLVVGGIGIMNMMLTTVTERTREIGLRKAIGARRRDISRQFLAEAVALTFSGGVLGILLGAAAAWLFRSLGGVAAVISWPSVVLACGVSSAIGIVFGYYPARRAARLNPIVALRYE